MDMFKEITQKDAQKALTSEINFLTSTIDKKYNEEKIKFEMQMKSFQSIFKRFVDGSDEFDWSNIDLLNSKELRSYSDLLESTDVAKIRANLDKLVVLKLNGGLGTTMGCIGPKSLISVRNDLTFLDLTIHQIETLNTKYDCNVPLVLMNSFNTEEETGKVLRKYQNVNVQIETFTQSMYPRINRESLLPIARNVDPALLIGKHSSAEFLDKPVVDISGWYPPGHGDVYRSFVQSGLAKKMIDAGKTWLFISNIDNLGACVDLNILNYVMWGQESSHPGFVMEVTEKTRNDVKGGTLVNYNGRLRLVELAQVPKERTEEFTTRRRFRIFNTNNLWAKLSEVKDLVDSDSLNMEVINNRKTLDSGLNIIQLEEAAGAAIGNFKEGLGITVPRSRYSPVKTTADLLVLMSNLFILENNHLSLSPKRSFPVMPRIKLGEEFRKVKNFLQRFSTIPDLLELDHLTIAGNVSFGKDVSLKGTVIIIANHGEKICIPSQARLENTIISGNLHILDH